MKWRNQNRGRIRSALAFVTVALIFASAGTAMAALGASTFVSTGDDGAATAHGAQAPLGVLSATPRADNNGGEEVGDVKDQTESDSPESPSGSENENAASPSDVVNTTTAGSSSKLPFTGLLAIPVLLAGAGLLGTGIVVRRRAARPASSS